MDARERERRIYVRNKRRKRRMIKKLLRLTMICCLFVVALQVIKAGAAVRDAVWDKSVPVLSTNVMEDGTEDERMQTILDHQEEYPRELLEMLTRNGDMLDFVLDYPEKKGNVYADTVGDVDKGTIPLLLQWDERWGYGQYGDGILAVCGCGPTALSMVAAGLTGDDTITPYVVARYADENGYYVSGSGSKWSLISEGCRKFGIVAEELSLSKTVVYDALEAGSPIICSMRPGDFTTSGHFIVLIGVENGKIKVNDSNSRERSERLWDYQTLENQIDNLWAFTLE